MKTFNIFFTVIIFLCLPLTKAFSQDCIWSSQAGGTGRDIAGWIVNDNNDNFYVAGGFTSYPMIFNTGELFRLGTNDIFLVKYDQTGNELWLKRLGGPNSAGEGIGGMIFDSNNNRLLISGTFDNTFPLTDTVLQGSGQTVFVLSMDTDGNVLWARAAGGPGSDIANDIACDNVGNIYVCGVNESEATFQGIAVPRGGFLAKYDYNGNLIWAKNKFRYFSINPPFTFWPYTESEPINLIFVNNSLIVNGNRSNDTIVIDTISYITPSNSVSAYLASFSPEGNIEWLSLIAGPHGDCGVKMSADGAGNTYVTGRMTYSGTFDCDTLVSTSLSGEDCYLAKYSPNGTCFWARNINPTDMARGSAVKSNHSGSSIYLSGNYRGNVLLGTTHLVSGYSQYGDIFLACYSSNGECRGGGGYYEGGITSITLDQNENVCISGTFENSISIGPNTFLSRGGNDMFAAKCFPITGIIQPKPESSNTLLIYANPNTGQCRVTIPEEFNHEKTLILEIYDQTGRLIQKASLNIIGDSIELDISAQAKGMYNAILSNGKKYYSGKIIFE